MNRTEVLEQSQAPAWLARALEKLESLAQLKENWDSHGGLRLRADVRASVARLLDELRTEELPIPAVVLGSAGTVQLEWRVAGRELEIEALPCGSFEFLRVSPDGRTEEGALSGDKPEELRHLARWVVHG